MLVLNEWFKVEELGTYKIDIRLKAAIHSKDAKDADLKASPFSTLLEVTERDPKHLAAIRLTPVKVLVATRSDSQNFNIR